MSGRLARVAEVLVFVGPVVATAVVGAYLAIESLHPGTLTAPRLATMSEAIAAGNAGQALEMMANGADVDAIATIRPGILDGSAHETTPLEAAILARRIESVRLLLRSGADPARTKRLPCLARERLPEAMPLFGLSGGDPEGPIAAPGEALHDCGEP